MTMPTITTMVDSTSSFRSGHEDLRSSATVSFHRTRIAVNGFFILRVSYRRNGGRRGTRTPNLRFWRPLLYQLSHSPPVIGTGTTCNIILYLNCVSFRKTSVPVPTTKIKRVDIPKSYSMTPVIRPEPMVRPPSRIAKR